MRIVIDCREFGPSSEEGMFVERLVHALEVGDCENEYILVFREGHRGYVPKNPNFRMERIWGGVLGSLAFSRKLYKIRPDVTVFPQVAVLPFFSGKSVVFVHDLADFFYPPKSMTGAMVRRKYRENLRSAIWKVNRIIVPTKRVRSELVEVLNVPEEKIAVVSPGVEGKGDRDLTTEEERTLARMGISGEYLLFSGDWMDRRNLVRLVLAYSILVKEGISENLVLLGQEDFSTHEVRDAIIREGLQKRVQILSGMTPEESDIAWRGARAFISASLYEGFPYVVAEAMVR